VGVSVGACGQGAVGEIATQDMCVLRHGKIVIAAFGREIQFRWVQILMRERFLSEEHCIALMSGAS
jgi:hypothetical protein